MFSGEALGVRQLAAALNIKLSEILSCEGGVEPPHSKGFASLHSFLHYILLIN
jgi:hypothetical protein